MLADQLPVNSLARDLVFVEGANVQHRKAKGFRAEAGEIARADHAALRQLCGIRQFGCARVLRDLRRLSFGQATVLHQGSGETA